MQMSSPEAHSKAISGKEVIWYNGIGTSDHCLKFTRYERYLRSFAMDPAKADPKTDNGFSSK